MENHKFQIFKFSMYGLLKNLRFFEPFLLIYLFNEGISLFEIGILWSIKEIVIYVFEIPSGVLADRFGKKTELLLCFIFYIISFVIFYFGERYGVFIIAFIIYGLGKAFRSGTHKAMIMAYLKKHNMKESKSQVYGLTRSYSLIGSFISSLLSIAFLLYLKEIRFLFLIAIVPYALDFFLILSYPNYINQRRDTQFKLKKFFLDMKESIVYSFKNSYLRKTIISSSSYDGLFKILKDYIQPLIVSVGIGWVAYSGQQDLSTRKTITIGLVYALVYIISAIASRNAHKISHWFTLEKIVNSIWLLTGVLFLLFGLGHASIIVISLGFLIFYVFLNIRKPYMVEKIGNTAEHMSHASVLSIESQLSSLFIIVFAPIIGAISDNFGLDIMFYFVGGLLLISYLIIGKIKQEPTS
ncbi:MAG: MFS transporter [Candidatus Izimaplasma sp.]|nr:MFS transporter [Candidatus Izimaplasma bacterium]